VRRHALILTGVSIFLAGCPVAYRENSGPTTVPDLRKEVLWEKSGNSIRYVVELTVPGDQVVVTLSLHNLSGKPIYLLADFPWEVWNDERMVAVRWGDSTFMFGVELPQMRRIDAGEHLFESTTLTLPIPWSDINVIKVGFFCLCDNATDLGRQLEPLPAVSGWWQTHDSELAEAFLNHLLLEEVVFYRTPMNPDGLEN
jgi:hypothetical protein